MTEAFKMETTPWIGALFYHLILLHAQAIWPTNLSNASISFNTDMH